MSEQRSADWSEMMLVPEIRAAYRLLVGTPGVCQAHARQVARLAIRLFDDLKPLHGLGTEARIDLAGAALLHDLGSSISEAGHHKHSRDLILRHHVGVDPHRRQRVALIARYHRKALPHVCHAYFRDLDETSQYVVTACMSCLRIADGLDRSHQGLANDIRLAIGTDTLELGVSLAGPGKAEIEAACRKSDGLARFTGRRILITGHDAPPLPSIPRANGLNPRAASVFP